MRKSLSTSAVARLLGVAASSVAKWIDQGQLKAGRTPGGHRRVEADDLVEFLRRQKLPVPSELAASLRRILIVDDDVSLAQLIASEIREQFPDCEVLEAYDGFSAGELVGSWRPTVVILDIRMPAIDGYEVCRRIKARKAAKDVAVIAMTAYPSPESETRILQCGARVCLTKPVTAAVLLKEVREALQQRG